MVTRGWLMCSLTVWMGYILKKKLKMIKENLKKWNKEIYGNTDVMIRLLVEEIKAVNIRDESRGLLEAEQSIQMENFAKWKFLKTNESTIFPSMWWHLKEWDANSSYF